MNFDLQKNLKSNPKESYIILVLALCIPLYIYNIFLDFYIDDAALYALISKNMLQSGDFFSLIHNQKDWLDKPHFPFWITLFFYKILGIKSFSYLLPLTLAIFASFLYTFKFTKKYYDNNTALLSVFILATSQYIFLASTEGRIEPYIMLSIIAAVYHFDQGFFEKKTIHLFLMAFFVAIGIMTKGIFIVIAIFGAILGHILYQNFNKKIILNWRWILIFCLVLLFILPEIVALYNQFDENPSKNIFEENTVSAVKWFLWDSQFSRLINSGPITRANGDPFFFLHTLIWAFFPWAILLYVSFYRTIKQLIKKEKINEMYSFVGGLLMLVIFSISKFQLPHYISIVFPFFSILIASNLQVTFPKIQQLIITYSQIIFIVFGIFLIIFLSIISKNGILIAVFSIVLFILNYLYLKKKNISKSMKLVFLSGSIAILINLYLSLTVYPKIIEYKGGINAANYLNEKSKPKLVATIGKVPNLFDFYSKSNTIKYQKIDEHIVLNADFVLTHLADSISKSIILKDYKVVKIFPHYDSENIDLNFLNPTKRDKHLSEFILYKRK